LYACAFLLLYYYYPFLQHDAMLARYMLSTCVRLSIHPPNAGIVPKQLNIG